MSAARREDADQSRTLDDFRRLDNCMTVAQIRERFGPPDGTGGSGFLILRYELADGNQVRIGSNGRSVLYVDHLVVDRPHTRLVPRGPIAFSPEWCTDNVVSLARHMRDSREFSAMPILADALQDAGCDDGDILAHCRLGSHVRGCWVVDLVLGKE